MEWYGNRVTNPNGVVENLPQVVDKLQKKMQRVFSCVLSYGVVSGY